MTPYYLKATTPEELQSALDADGLYLEHEDGAHTYYGSVNGFILVWIGEIFERTGVILNEGTEDERPEFASVGGYHCNVYSDKPLPEELQLFEIVPPTTPHTKLAGVD